MHVVCMTWSVFRNSEMTTAVIQLNVAAACVKGAGGVSEWPDQLWNVLTQIHTAHFLGDI